MSEKRTLSSKPVVDREVYNRTKDQRDHWKEMYEGERKLVEWQARRIEKLKALARKMGEL